MSSIVQLKRSALSGKVPGTGSLNLGELALNTYDGKIFFRRSGSTDTIQEVVTTNVLNTGSVTITGTLTAESIVGSISASNGVVSGSSQIVGILSSLNSYTASYATTGSNQFTSDQNITGSLRATGTGSFGSLKVNDTLTINHGEAIISGSALVTSDLTILGQVNARQFNISIISSSVLFESGSSRFGNTLDDTHDFTGSVNVTGSLYLNGVAVGASSNSGSFTGSFSGDGSGLRGVVSDDIPRDGWDYDSNSSASISDFNSVSDKYFIDFEQSQSTAVGTPVGFKGFMTNVSGSTQILPTLDSIDFIVRDNLVASIGVGGIIATAPAGTVSGSSQLTSSYDSRYVLSGSITQTTWDNIASKPNGIISGSSQLTSSMLATTGSNTFVGTQTLSGSIIPAIDNAYDLGSATYQWRDIYVSSGSLYIDGTKVLGSTGNELQITTDVGQSIKILEAGSDSIILQSADGDIQLKTSGGGNLLFDPTTGLIDVRGTLQIQDGNKITSSGGLGIVFGNNIVVSGSIESTGTINGITLSTFSSSVATQISTIQTKTGSFATTGSNSFIGNQNISGTIYLTGSIIPSGSFIYDLGSETNSFRDLFLSTGSIRFHNPDGSEQGRITVDAKSGDISLLKTAGLTNEQKATISQGNINPDFLTAISASSLFIQTKIVTAAGATINGINLTAFSSSVSSSYETKGRGIISSSAQLPSGVISGSAQLENATITNLTITNLTTVNETASVIFSSGSNRFGDFGDDVHDFTGSVKISGSFTLVGSSTATSYNGTINATNGVVSGSSQVVSILSSLNTYTGSNDTTNTAQNSRLTTIESVTGSYETKGRSIVSGSSQITFSGISSLPTLVSGSSQIDVMSTTNIARLATTGSNTFNGNQTITGSISTTDNITAGYNAAHKIVNSSNGQVGGFSRRGLWEGNSNLDPAIWAEGGSGVYIYTNGSATPKLVAESGGTIRPGANGTQDLGSSSYRWGTVYTSDLSLNNGIGDWTIVEGEDDLFLYNNKKGKVYKFALTEVDPSVATPKKS